MAKSGLTVYKISGRIKTFLLPILICGEERKMTEKPKNGEAAERAWKAFEKTGKISYYILYNDLKKR